MRILNLGSLNYDRVYTLPHFTRAGETVSAEEYGEFLGGKGLNQSIALARAGARVFHAGCVGPDGAALLGALRDSGVDTTLVRQVDTASGHAVIQRVGARNSIVVCGGANHCVDEAYIDAVLEHFSAGDLLLTQNETACVGYAIRRAKARGMVVALNPSPVTPALLLDCPAVCIDYLLLNEVEGSVLAASRSQNFSEITALLARKFPHAAIVLTVGSDGALYRNAAFAARQAAFRVRTVDTTGAGDAFTGFFLAARVRGVRVREALRIACAAGALTVGKMGAANSIPTMEAVERFLGGAGG